jgi:hypothetical protein
MVTMKQRQKISQPILVNEIKLYRYGECVSAATCFGDALDFPQPLKESGLIVL